MKQNDCMAGSAPIKLKLQRNGQMACLLLESMMFFSGTFMGVAKHQPYVVL